MEKWQKILQQSLIRPEEIAAKFDIPLQDIQGLEEQLKFKITPHYLSLIKQKGDAMYRQVVPDKQELIDYGLYIDPLGEDWDAPAHNIVHRYPDRVLFLVSHVCASYCRFCTRKRKVGDPDKISLKYVDEAIAYIAAHREVRDVVLSGGDPLMLVDKSLENILKKLRSIPHIEIIRIHTRVPVFLPQRITNRLVRMLRRYHPLYMNVHFNHPDELVPVTVKALGRLADAGIPLGNQTVLLKGVNDDAEVMKRLLQKLLQARVRPYYIYQADMVFGTEHLRTSVAKGLEIMEALRGWTSGMAVPYFVIDAPGGGGKIPVLPQYILKMTDSEVVLRNYMGNIYRYTQSPKNGEMVIEEVMEELVTV